MQYVVMGRHGTHHPWEVCEREFELPEAAIEYARHLLDIREYKAAVVQGRGTPERPTPPGQVQIWLGVAYGMNWKAFFPMHKRDEVEHRNRRRS